MKIQKNNERSEFSEENTFAWTQEKEEELEERLKKSSMAKKLDEGEKRF